MTIRKEFQVLKANVLVRSPLEIDKRLVTLKPIPVACALCIFMQSWSLLIHHPKSWNFVLSKPTPLHHKRYQYYNPIATYPGHQNIFTNIILQSVCIASYFHNYTYNSANHFKLWIGSQDHSHSHLIGTSE